jgi:hypothetical protein
MPAVNAHFHALPLQLLRMLRFNQPDAIRPFTQSLPRRFNRPPLNIQRSHFSWPRQIQQKQSVMTVTSGRVKHIIARTPCAANN